MNVIHLLKRAGSIIPAFRNTSFETAMIYDRADGKRVEFVVVHIPNISGDAVRKPYVALSSRSIKRNPNCTPNALLNLDMQEARFLRDFLNKPEVVEWLDEEE